MKRIIAIASATALLVVGTAFVVHAQTTGGIPACADLVDGSGVYTPPGIASGTGKLTWTMELAAVSCPNVQYGVTVFLDGPDGDAAPILGSASTMGDLTSDTLTFQLEINSHNAANQVCVVQTTVGSTGTKSGAAFDGTGLRLLDRGPDGPVPGDGGSGPDYCVDVGPGGSSGRTAG